MVDLDLLVKPISGNSPCGPDLDLEGDIAYLNFFASTEPLLPRSYFEVPDAEGNRKRFDPNSIKFDEELAKAKPLLNRTRDLRLTVFLAKIAILSRDLESFARCLEAVAVLLEQHWDDVHPRMEDGDLSHRQFAIEALDALTTVVIPLQFHPLLNSRRYGWISYRAWLIVKGDAPPRDDDIVLDRGGLAQVIAGADLEQIKSMSGRFSSLAATLGSIKRIWNEKSQSPEAPSLGQLFGLVTGINTFLADVIQQRDPTAVAKPEFAQDAEVGEVASSASAADGARRVNSISDAAAALGAVATYFRQSEPSSPVLLLVLQAQQMLGKSFVEALRMLLPSHAETAVINIGKDRFFDLSIERMAGLLEEGALAPTQALPAQPVALTVTQRGQALALLEQVGAFYRVVEPSSPVPYLTDRARELAQRDFLSLLREVLPEGTLRALDNQG
ncbi:ImpA family type VI secretion system protein [Bradyrhizobium sp. AUGA SZCCT0182]|uniref:type VI secretion system protein TssA n=1 Tax=Bradyrhizobium sp. AUGA SZCCT0182 TaxID=2807667 RepID=UPI001BA4C774|nr:type VI secretion system ImpA family N-terminal domain-containing protein [Bradyrhizobium sp. AUGA SZCCT0182]MBR1232067.1 type VI secretion system ImpA family N-terminal domain-containing protein [Bradyrhizobium sp. AUGA SZCCT0182]